MHVCSGPKFMYAVEIRRVMKDLAEGDIDVCGKLQPRLFAALPMIQQPGAQRPVIAFPRVNHCDRMAVLKILAAAASRGLALVRQVATNIISKHWQGLLCIARCCYAVCQVALACISTSSSTTTRRGQVEVAVAVQSSGAQHSTDAAACSSTQP